VGEHPSSPQPVLRGPAHAGAGGVQWGRLHGLPPSPVRWVDAEVVADAAGSAELLRQEILEERQEDSERDADEGEQHGPQDEPVGPHGFEGIDVIATDIYLQLVDPHGCTLQRSPNLGDQALLTDTRSLAPWALLSTIQHATLGCLRQYVRPVPIDRETYWVAVAEPLAPVDAALNALLRLFTLFLPSAVLPVGLGGYLLASRALRPVNEVIDAARAIRAGDLSRRIALAGPPDELQRLADTFDEMIAALEALVRTQHRFVADASHELRTPLTIIDSCLQVHLRAREAGVEQLREALLVIRQETQRMKRLVDDLLTLARADAGEEQLHWEVIPLTPLLEEVYERSQWLMNGHTLRLEVAHELTVRGDADRLKQLLLNLLDNAFKHTPPSGKILLRAQRQGTWVRVDVTDTGSGIPAEHLPHIFDRFYRVDKARSREAGGSGLGLSIARWIAEAHGGRIKVQSEAGRGATFTVLLPPEPSLRRANEPKS
jgi:heavy metal sensor kinase